MNTRHLIPAITLALIAGAAAAAFSRDAASPDSAAGCAPPAADRLSYTWNAGPAATNDRVPRVVVIGRRAGGAPALAAPRP